MGNPFRPSSLLALGLGATLALSLSACSTGGTEPSANDSAAQTEQNLLTAAVAWRVTAAERDNLYLQGFNILTDRVDAALANKDNDKPLAIISDIDDTVLSSDDYWKQLIASGKQSFDDELWDQWVADNGPTPTAGSLKALEYAAEKGVEVFYVSSRDQGEETQRIGVANLKAAGLPFADDEHVTMLRESSDKEEAQQKIADDYEVIAYLGDNLNDFKRKYYVESVSERKSLALEDAEEFGRKFILFPNATDGHWMKAIFGDSEPADSPEYRERFTHAAKTGN